MRYRRVVFEIPSHGPGMSCNGLSTSVRQASNRRSGVRFTPGALRATATSSSSALRALWNVHAREGTTRIQLTRHATTDAIRQRAGRACRVPGVWRGAAPHRVRPRSPEQHRDHVGRPALARFLERLATMGRVICFDKRGTGISDPVPLGAIPTIERWMDDITTVIDAVGSTRIVVSAMATRARSRCCSPRRIPSAPRRSCSATPLLACARQSTIRSG